jgi:hypothetical protein
VKGKKDRKPFLVEPVISADLVGTRAAGRAAALARARRVADRHRLTVAVWHETPAAGGAARRIDLVRLVHPRGRKARATHNGKPPAA